MKFKCTLHKNKHWSRRKILKRLRVDWGGGGHWSQGWCFSSCRVARLDGAGVKHLFRKALQPVEEDVETGQDGETQPTDGESADRFVRQGDFTYRRTVGCRFSAPSWGIPWSRTPSVGAGSRREPLPPATLWTARPCTANVCATQEGHVGLCLEQKEIWRSDDEERKLMFWS